MFRLQFGQVCVMAFLCQTPQMEGVCAPTSRHAYTSHLYQRYRGLTNRYHADTPSLTLHIDDGPHLPTSERSRYNTRHFDLMQSISPHIRGGKVAQGKPTIFGETLERKKAVHIPSETNERRAEAPTGRVGGLPAERLRGNPLTIPEHIDNQRVKFLIPLQTSDFLKNQCPKYGLTR